MNAFDPYHRWLGIPPEEQPPNHYRLFSIPLLESDRDVIQEAAERQIGHVRRYCSGPHAEDANRILGELAQARICLLSSNKDEYDRQLAVSLGKTEENSRETTAPPPVTRPLPPASAPTPQPTPSATPIPAHEPKFVAPPQRKSQSAFVIVAVVAGIAIVAAGLVGAMMLFQGGPKDIRKDPLPVARNDAVAASPVSDGPTEEPEPDYEAAFDDSGDDVIEEKAEREARIDAALTRQRRSAYAAINDNAEALSVNLKRLPSLNHEDRFKRISELQTELQEALESIQRLVEESKSEVDKVLRGHIAALHDDLVETQSELHVSMQTFNETWKPLPAPVEVEFDSGARGMRIATLRGLKRGHLTTRTVRLELQSPPNAQLQSSSARRFTVQDTSGADWLRFELIATTDPPNIVVVASDAASNLNAPLTIRLVARYPQPFQLADSKDGVSQTIEVTLLPPESTAAATSGAQVARSDAENPSIDAAATTDDSPMPSSLSGIWVAKKTGTKYQLTENGDKLQLKVLESAQMSSGEGSLSRVNDESRVEWTGNQIVAWKDDPKRGEKRRLGTTLRKVSTNRLVLYEDRIIWDKKGKEIKRFRDADRVYLTRVE